MIKGSIWNKDLEKLFSSRFDEEIFSCDVLSSHGSDRIIIRINSQNNNSAIGIINKNVKENRAFLEFSKHFAQQGISVPNIYGIAGDFTSYLMEDLGNLTLYEYLRNINKNNGEKKWLKELIRLYREAIHELLRFQIEAGTTINYKYCYQFDKFGKENIEYDLKYFENSFLKKFYTNPLDASKFESDLNTLKLKLLKAPANYFLYRDFQSRNIMIKDNKLYFIDFQSGRKGALQYDLASLLFDARADIPQETRELLIDFYTEHAENSFNIHTEQFEEYFWYFAVIRILQAMGAYGFLGLTKGKKQFLESVPYAVNNIKLILENKIPLDSLKYLRQIFSELSEEKSILLFNG